MMMDPSKAQLIESEFGGGGISARMHALDLMITAVAAANLNHLPNVQFVRLDAAIFCIVCLLTVILPVFWILAFCASPTWAKFAGGIAHLLKICFELARVASRNGPEMKNPNCGPGTAF